ncbi:MAG: calcium-binding protein [Acetobacteraceae bacterium]|nr:calcium-binding protein [Acetobacteraceae bacterium]
MINFARLLLFPGQTNALSGLFESDWDYGRAIHFVAPQALIRQFDAQTLSEIAPSILWLQGVVSAADIAISADWRFELYNQGTITNRLFLTLTEGGHATDGRYAITGSAYADEVHNAGRIEGAVLLDAGDDLLDGRLGVLLGAADGGAGDDTLLSGAAAETLLGGDGRDWLDGGAGADSLSGGAGANQVFAGAGNDSVTSEDGDDVIAGDAGDDWLLSDRGHDSVSGGDGADTLIGGDGNDTLAGGAGDDVIDAWDDRDLAWGGDGHDTITVWGGDDTVFGGAGDDVILAGTASLEDILSLFAF